MNINDIFRDESSHDRSHNCEDCYDTCDPKPYRVLKICISGGRGTITNSQSGLIVLFFSEIPSSSPAPGAVVVYSLSVLCSAPNIPSTVSLVVDSCQCYRFLLRSRLLFCGSLHGLLRLYIRDAASTVIL